MACRGRDGRTRHQCPYTLHHHHLDARWFCELQCPYVYYVGFQGIVYKESGATIYHRGLYVRILDSISQKLSNNNMDALVSFYLVALMRCFRKTLGRLRLVIWQRVRVLTTDSAKGL